MPAPELDDKQLAELLTYYNIPRGPIVGSTRNLYKSLVLKKLAEKPPPTNFLNQVQLSKEKISTSINDNHRAWQSDFNSIKPLISTINQIDEEEEDQDQEDEDEEEDEDYQVEDEEEDDEDEDTEDNEDKIDEEDSEELLNELSDDDDGGIKIQANRTQTGMSATMTAAISKSIVTIIITFFIAIFSFYLYSTSNPMFPANLQKLTKLLLVILAFSPIGYIVYKTISFYIRRRNEENQRVHNMVSESLEIIQSPENPRGLMPILHIRDTLLTPAERKTNKMIQLWNKVVKFVEKHESRVKIEMINIDGEDFRAWKWIGLKNSNVN